MNELQPQHQNAGKLGKKKVDRNKSNYKLNMIRDAQDLNNLGENAENEYDYIIQRYF